jgi:hypothetical protein
LDWIAERFPKQADPKSPGRQALSNGKVRKFKVTRAQNGDLQVEAFVISKINKKWFWSQLTLQDGGDIIAEECACKSKYGKQFFFTF